MPCWGIVSQCVPDEWHYMSASAAAAVADMSIPGRDVDLFSHPGGAATEH